MQNKSLRLAPTMLASALVLVLLTLSGCGSKDEKKAATQVAAKVGSEEISVHQINQVLSRSNTAGATPEAVKAMSREVLEKLIDQQLAVDQATETKLHRSPEVVAQIETARRDILARAYMQTIASGLAKPTPEEIKQYFTEHPALFAQRRIYNVQEIVVPVAAGVAEQLRGFAAAAKPMEDVAAWLKGKDIKFGGGSATRAAEQIPLELLTKIHALKDGQSTLLETPQTVTLLRIASSQSAPVAQADALPRIEQFLTNQRATQAVTARIKQLRTDTKITYMGEFGNADGTPAVAATAPAPAPAPAESASAAADAGKAALEKGIAGLK
jgi:EpsD family peptidyl-prolyl cis-trans isomerase